MTMQTNPYDVGLDKNPANYASLTPIDFIAWSARVCPTRVAVIHGERRFTWAETYARSRRLASALVGMGITVGDTVAALLSNTPEHYEAHFGVPMTGAVLNALNTRLDARAIRVLAAASASGGSVRTRSASGPARPIRLSHQPSADAPR